MVDKAKNRHTMTTIEDKTKYTAFWLSATTYLAIQLQYDHIQNKKTVIV